MSRFVVAVGVTLLSVAPAAASLESLFACRLPVPAAVKLDAATLQLVAFQAAREGDLPTLREYFRAGFAVNSANARGDTLLTVAAYNHQPAAVELILAQPAVDVDRRTRVGLTALAAAAFQGDVKAAKLLRAAGADVNLADARGRTALMFAALSGRTAAVKWLLKEGADPLAADRDGKTALSLAEEQGAAEAAALLRAALKK